MVTHLYHLVDELPPGVMSKWKSTVVSNEVLGYALVRIGLHTFIRHSSASLADDIEKFVNMANLTSTLKDILYPVSDTTDEFSDCNRTAHSTIPTPKALGDVFESLLGAVYIDSGGDISVVRTIVENNLIRHYVDEAYTMSADLEWGTHENPAAVLPEILSKIRCTEWKIDFTIDGKGMYCCDIKIHNTSESATARTKAAAKKKACSAMLRGDPSVFSENVRSFCQCKVLKLTP